MVTRSKVMPGNGSYKGLSITLGVLLFTLSCFFVWYVLRDKYNTLIQSCAFVENKQPLAKKKPVTQTVHVIEQSQQTELEPPQTKITNTALNADKVQMRDERVLYDPLYPPLNRSNTETTARYIASIRPTATRDTSDTYRIVGYLVDEEDKNETWKLYAREQHRGGRADFYATPANRNFDVKVSLDNNVITSKDKFRDMYSIPDQVRINHPMFSQSSYKVVELPKTDFNSNYY
jgi:hypothetical protein